MDETDVQKIVSVLEQAIAGLDFRTGTVTLTGYTDTAVKLACQAMKTAGHTFDGYTYNSSRLDTDYDVSAKSGGTNVSSGVFVASLQYAFPEMTSEEAVTTTSAFLSRPSGTAGRI